MSQCRNVFLISPTRHVSSHRPINRDWKSSFNTNRAYITMVKCLGLWKIYSENFLVCLFISTLPPDWYTNLLGTSTSHRCCETFTGCGLLNASTSSWLCSSTNAFMVWRHGTFPTTSSSLLILTAAVCGRRHPCSWRPDVHGCPLSATVRFQWPDCRLWNSLPSDVMSAPTLTVFRNRLKTHLFSRSFPA